jgi:hypothetical protein
MAQGAVLRQGWTPTPLVTTLPTSPKDGDEVYFLASEPNSIVWHLRYRANLNSFYKWECVGGNGLMHEIQPQETTSSTTYADLATVGPTIVVPLAGDFRVGFGCKAGGSVATAVQFMSLKIATAATADIDGLPLQPPGANYVAAGQSARTRDINLVSRFNTVKCQYKTNTGLADFQNRWMEIRPIRCG